MLNVEVEYSLSHTLSQEPVVSAARAVVLADSLITNKIRGITHDSLELE